MTSAAEELPADNDGQLADRETMPVRPRRHPFQILAACLAVLLTAVFIQGFAASPNIAWGVVGHYLFARTIITGVGVTLVLTFLAMLLASLIGLGLAVMRLSDNRLLRAMAAFYLWFFRGIPLIVLLILFYNLALVFQHLTLGVPFTGLSLVRFDTNQVITPFIAAVFGLALAEGAYMGEIIRAGILSVDRGQRDAAASLGMTNGYQLRRIVLPQSMRVILPPAGNETIGMLKGTSLVSVISGQELLTRAQIISAENYRVVELLLVATAWYLLLASIFTVGQQQIEKRYGRGFDPRAPLPSSRLSMPKQV